MGTIFIRWLNANSLAQLMSVGVLIVTFEVAFGRQKHGRFYP